MKTRYRIPIENKLVAEVDVFHGKIDKYDERLLKEKEIMKILNINFIKRYNNNIHFAKIKIFTFCEMNDIIYLR